jgi:hypothetical protein
VDAHRGGAGGLHTEAGAVVGGDAGGDALVEDVEDVGERLQLGPEERLEVEGHLRVQAVLVGQAELAVVDAVGGDLAAPVANAHTPSDRRRCRKPRPFERSYLARVGAVERGRGGTTGRMEVQKVLVGGWDLGSGS